MNGLSRGITVWLILILALVLGQRVGHAAEMRFALVIGNDEYKTAKLATPANDAGLVANALQAAGFTVTGARNVDQATLRESFREFLGQVATAGPEAVALIYLAGFGLQYEGENYFIPVDADIQRDVDVPLQAVRISDFTQPLAALPGAVKIVVLDAARQGPFARNGQPLASGFALVDPVPSMAVAFNSAPGTVGPEEQGPYGAYANSLAEMIAAGGLSLDDLFARVRLRVSDLTQGAEVPWYTSGIDHPFFMTERLTEAPPLPKVVPLGELREKPMRRYSRAEKAYEAALELDTIDAYEQYLAAYPDSPFARRVVAMLAARREAMIWRHCVLADTPQAYWSYLRRYPNGPHVYDARRRLTILAVALEPPRTFAFIDFGVPPPPPAELVFIDRPVLIFAGPEFVPPPPPPVLFLPPRSPEFVALPPPPPPTERFFLPTPARAAVPVFAKPPSTVVIRPTPAGRPVPVALPAAVQSSAAGHPPGTKPGAQPGVPALVKPLPMPNQSGAPSAAPVPSRPAALVKPATPPPHPAVTAPASVKPATPPPHPAVTAPASVKPATPPPHPAVTAPASVKPAPPPHPAVTAPASVKPATPPPHPAVTAPASVKPAPPPPHPANAPGSKPACPPGKTLATVGGHAMCR